MAALPVALVAMACRAPKPVPEPDCAKYARTELRCFLERAARQYMPPHGTFEARYLVDAAASCALNQKTPPEVGSNSPLDAEGKRFEVACGVEAVDCSDLAQCELEVSVGVGAREHIARARQSLGDLDIQPGEMCGEIATDREWLAKSRRSEERTLFTETASLCGRDVWVAYATGKLRVAEDTIRISNAKRVTDPTMDFPYEIIQSCGDAFSAIGHIVEPYRSEASVAAVINRVTARCSQDAVRALSYAWVDRKASRSH